MRALLVLIAACGGAPKTEPIANTTAPPSVATCTDKCMPGVTFVDLHGTTHHRGTLAGHVVVINFFATWNNPSKKELPVLAAAAVRYTGKVVFLGVLAADEVGDAELAPFLAQYGVNFPVARSTPDIMAAFAYPAALPTTFIYDERGALAKTHVGMYTEQTLAADLDKLVTK